MQSEKRKKARILHGKGEERQNPTESVDIEMFYKVSGIMITMIIISEFSKFWPKKMFGVTHTTTLTLLFFCIRTDENQGPENKKFQKRWKI